MTAPKVDVKGGILIVEIPLLDTPKETEKMFLVASTGGFIDTGLKVQGQPLRLNLMAGTRKA